MRYIWLLVLLAFPALAQSAPAPVVVSVRIEADGSDRTLLLQKLNSNGQKQGLKWDQWKDPYEYRIVFSTADDPSHWLTLNSASASAEVYDAAGKLLFRVSRENRASVAGAANAVAKEIIKRILRLRHP